MATWIKIEEDLPDHFKLANMRRILKSKSIIEPLGYFVMLMLYTLKVAWRDGNLQAYGDDLIEEKCLWVGEQGQLMKAFRECGKKLEDGSLGPGFMDGYVVHDWVQRSNKLIRDRIYREERNGGDGKVDAPTSDSLEIFEAWNAFAKENGLAAAARAPRIPDGMNPGRFAVLLAESKKYPFLLGSGPQRWRMDIHWLLRPENADKVMSGSYAERKAQDSHIPGAAEGDHNNYRKQTKEILERRAQKEKERLARESSHPA